MHNHSYNFDGGDKLSKCRRLGLFHIIGIIKSTIRILLRKRFHLTIIEYPFIIAANNIMHIGCGK